MGRTLDVSGHHQEDTIVAVVTMRGRDDASDIVVGKGGIAPGRLLNVDLSVHGTTFLWERVYDILRELAEQREDLPNMRIVFLDLSGSMTNNTALLKRMWSSIPPTGVKLEGIEVLVVTDGDDNQSADAFHGSAGLLELVQRLRELGYDTGVVEEATSTVTHNDAVAFAKVYIMLLDVGDGSVSKELTKLGSPACIMATRDPNVVARVMRTIRPSNLRCSYTSQEIESTWPEMTASECEEVDEIERYLHGNRKHLSLRQLFDKRIVSIVDPVARADAYKATISILHTLLRGESFVVRRRGESKNRSHSEINAVLYDLERWGGTTCAKNASPRVWTRGVMAARLMEELADLEETPSEKIEDANSTVTKKRGWQDVIDDQPL